MPTTSTKRSLRFPGGIETPDVPADLGRLVADLEAEVAYFASQPILDTGQVGQIRAGRDLFLTDFTLAGLSLTAPVAIWNLSNVSDDSGNARVLTNKGTVPFGTGILGAASSAAVFAGSTAQALYIPDAGGADPFRIRTGSIGCWFRTAKRSQAQGLITRQNAADTSRSYSLTVSAQNALTGAVSLDGTTWITVGSTTDICDDRWHFVVLSFDGTLLRLYLDGNLEASIAASGIAAIPAVPFNVGSFGADAATASVFPFYGRIDAAFVTTDSLSADDIRYLMCTKFLHGFASSGLRIPRTVDLLLRRLSRGAILAAADFPQQPRRLYNLQNATDLGANALNLTPAGNIFGVPGVDGIDQRAVQFDGTGSYSAADTGLPAGTSTRTFGLWFKTNQIVVSGLIGWGTTTTNDTKLGINTNGILVSSNASDNIQGIFVADGQWHHAVMVEDNAAADGVKRKMYLDGKLIGVSLFLNPITLAGAARFRIGAYPDATNIFSGSAQGAFVDQTAYTPEQIIAVMNKSSKSLGTSPKSAGEHVERLDGTALYTLFDSLESNQQVDLRVAS